MNNSNKKTSAKKPATKKVVVNPNKRMTAAEQLAQLQKQAEELGLTEVKKRGRKVDPNSARQQRLREQARRQLENGGVAKRGRPIDPDSERQKKLAAQQERAAANGGVARRGRPVDPNSARQQKLQADIEKLQALLEEAKND